MRPPRRPRSGPHPAGWDADDADADVADVDYTDVDFTDVDDAEVDGWDPADEAPTGPLAAPPRAHGDRGATAVEDSPALPSTRPRVRLRVGVGAVVVLVGAALVATILVTAVQSAGGVPAAGSPSLAGDAADAASDGAGETARSAHAGSASRTAGDPDAVGGPPGPPSAAGEGGPGTSDAVDGDGTGVGDDGSAADRTPIYVHVVGAVVSPGLFPLAPGSRVVDALAAAHGFADGADAAGVNLARVLSDGEQLVVPRQGEAPAAPPASGSTGAGDGTATPSAPVDLNTATAEQLETLPRVGPSLAARIIAWRAAHGRFGRVTDLGRVPGIGDRTLASLTPLVRV